MSKGAIIFRSSNRSAGSVIPVTCVLISMISVQSGAAVAERLFPSVGAEGATALRLFFGMALLGAIWRPWRGGLTRRQTRRIGFYGLTLVSMNLLFYKALETLPIGPAVAIELVGPLSLAVLTSRRMADLAWIAVAVCGLALLLPLAHFSAALDLKGSLYAATAGIFWALYIVAGQKAGADFHRGRVAALGMMVAAIVALPIGLVHAGWGLFDLHLLPIALAVGLMSSAIPYSLDLVAMTNMPTAIFGLMMSLAPVIGALAGRVFLHENLTPLQWAAMLCIVAATCGSRLTSRTPPPPIPPEAAIEA